MHLPEANKHREADLVLPSIANLAHQLAPNMVGRGRDALGNTNSPHLGYTRSAYPYSLPSNFTAPAMEENMDHAIPFTFKGLDLHGLPDSMALTASPL